MSPLAKPRSALRDFIKSESSSGIVLMVAALVAMIVANSPLGDGYKEALHHYFFGISVEHWVNDALMAIFFLLVGLEIKREVTDGQLSTWPRRALPGVAAIGGMVVPALIYIGINISTPETLRGWAIPAATDIAFALGVLSLLGNRVPFSLKVFLTALAVLDDLGAIIIIALFYTPEVEVMALAGAGLTLFMMFVLNRLHVVRLWIYLILAAVLWWFVYQSGVHATLAGVAAALMIPAKRTPAMPESEDSPLHRLEHGLAPWVAFLVLPIFGFANAGVSLSGLSLADFLAPAPLGVAAGLFVGKQVGVFGAAWLAARFGIAERPAGATWLQVYAVALLCGIGFTMSLFIGLLAFEGQSELIDTVKLGVLTGSILSAIVGALILRFAPRHEITPGSEAMSEES